VIQTPKLGARIMRYELADYEWVAIKPMLPNKPRGVPRVNDRRVLNGIFWVLRSGAPWRDLPDHFGPYTTWRIDQQNSCAGGYQWPASAARADSRTGARQPARQQTLSRLKPKAMLLADRGCDADWVRELAMRRGAWANIPPKRNRSNPTSFGPYLYRDRNRIERFFNRIKQCRRVATRYDKLAANYLAFVQLASIRLWLRAYESTS
jgi:transposase